LGNLDGLHSTGQRLVRCESDVHPQGFTPPGPAGTGRDALLDEQQRAELAMAQAGLPPDGG
jgi:hypothetical protein